MCSEHAEQKKQLAVLTRSFLPLLLAAFSETLQSPQWGSGPTPPLTPQMLEVISRQSPGPYRVLTHPQPLRCVL